MSGPVVAVFAFCCCCLLALATGQFSEVKTVTVPARWKKILDYDNHNSNPVTVTTKTIKGFANKHVDQQTLTASNTFSAEIEVGANFKVANISVKLGYSQTQSSDKVTMDERDVYGSTELDIISTIQALKHFYKWQLAATVNGEEVLFNEYVDAENSDGTRPIDSASVTVLLAKQIVQGETKFRIMHKEKKQFITVVSRKNWPAATLSLNSGFYFQLGSYKAYGGYRIITMNTTYGGYDAMYSSDQGGIYFDVQNDNSKQFWIVSKEPPFFLGDVVTFANGYWTGSGLSCYDGPATKVYCLTGTENEWLLV